MQSNVHISPGGRDEHQRIPRNAAPHFTRRRRTERSEPPRIPRRLRGGCRSRRGRDRRDRLTRSRNSNGRTVVGLSRGGGQGRSHRRHRRPGNDGLLRPQPGRHRSAATRVGARLHHRRRRVGQAHSVRQRRSGLPVRVPPRRRDGRTAPTIRQPLHRGQRQSQRHSQPQHVRRNRLGLRVYACSVGSSGELLPR